MYIDPDITDCMMYTGVNKAIDTDFKQQNLI